MTIDGWDLVSLDDDCFVYNDDAALFEMQVKLLARLKERWEQEDRNGSPLVREFISTPRSKGWVHELWERECETSEHGTPLSGKDE